MADDIIRGFHSQQIDKKSGLTIGNTFSKHFFALVAELPLRYLRTLTRFLLGEREEALLKTVGELKRTAGTDSEQHVRIVHQLQIVSQYARHSRSLLGKQVNQKQRQHMRLGWKE